MKYSIEELNADGDKVSSLTAKNQADALDKALDIAREILDTQDDLSTIQIRINGQIVNQIVIYTEGDVNRSRQSAC